MTIASKKTVFTAAVAVGVLAAGSAALPAGKEPIAAIPAKEVTISAGPSLAALATPNTLFAAVSGFAGGAGPSAGATARRSPR
jgi:hypothetical protein